MMTAAQHPDSAWKQKFRRRIKSWYGKHARDLPWRDTQDPYAIWVSEIMLQQTQVATVIPYYERFLNTFPTVVDLADADEEEVLRLWEGLGYYRRARQMHKAAQVVRDDHNGTFPTTVDGILDLPGIGRYTAGAVASFAYDLAAPIVEANTARLYSRLIGLDVPVADSAGQKELWRFAEEILTRNQPGLLNQAMMELGSQICTPKSPDCPSCPIRDLCITFSEGLQDQIPAAKKKTVYTEVNEAALIIRDGNRILMRICQPDQRWAGLWDFPRFEIEPDESDNGIAMAQRVKDHTGITIDQPRQVTVIKHGVTRYRITLTCHTAQYEEGQPVPHHHWKSVDEIREMPLNVTGRKLFKLIEP